MTDLEKKELDDTPEYVQEELDEFKEITTREVNKLALRRSDFEGFLQTLYHGGCILVGVLLLRHIRTLSAEMPDSSCLYISEWLSVLLLAYFLSFLFMPLHECIHQTAFKTPMFNSILAHIVGFASMRPANNYKYYHYAHHRFTGDPKKDPELSNSFLDPHIRNWGHYLTYMTGIPFWIDATMTLVQHCSGAEAQFLITKKSRYVVVTEARIYMMSYIMLAIISYICSSSVLLNYWVIPSLLGQPMLRFYLIAEHHGCRFSNKMFSNTRTTETYLFYRRLAWNMPFHIEHHAWPQVPFYLLPGLHRKLKSQIDTLGDKGCTPAGTNGYFSLHGGLWKTLSNKSNKVS